MRRRMPWPVGVITVAMPLVRKPNPLLRVTKSRTAPRSATSSFPIFRSRSAFIATLSADGAAAMRDALRHDAARAIRHWRRYVPPEQRPAGRHAEHKNRSAPGSECEIAGLLASGALMLKATSAGSKLSAWPGPLVAPAASTKTPNSRPAAWRTWSPHGARAAPPPPPPAPPAPPAPPRATGAPAAPHQARRRPRLPSSPPAAPAPPAKPPVDPLWVAPLINPDKLVVVVKKTYTNPKRQTLTLTTDSPFDGTGTMTVAGPAGVKFFDAATGGNQVAASGSQDYPGATLTAGVTLWVEGVTASTAMDDLVVTLALQGGSKNRRPPVKSTITVVDLLLDICMSRAVVNGDRPKFSQSDKLAVGRFVHRQIDRMHGRARLVVEPVKPSHFTGTLTLTPITAGGKRHRDPVCRRRRHSHLGQTALTTPYEFPAPTVGTGLDFFTEGTTTSAALRDTGWMLGVKGIEPDVDHVTMTVVEFSNLVATVPTTAANTSRLNNATTPATSTLTIGSGAACSSTIFRMTSTTRCC